MKPLKGALGHLTLTLLFILSLILFAKSAFAENTQQVIDEPNDGTVEVIYAPEVLAPYKERQSDWSIIGGIHYSEFYPDKFRSEIDNFSYDQLFDSYPMDMIEGEVGLNYNTDIGAFGIGAALGYASVNGNAKVNGQKVGGPRDMNIKKYGLTGTFTLDKLFPEPYVAPYVGAQVFTVDWEENDPTNKRYKSGSTQPSVAFTAGILIQLNWIDPNSALMAQSSSGLNNTFLDLFVNQYNTSDNNNERNFETDINLGGGLKLEF